MSSYMDTGRLALGLLFLFLLSGIGTAAETGAEAVQQSEPVFLHDIGPQTERQDNWVAAAVVAFGVAFVVLRGLIVDGRTS
jgi:hypothetical protein